METPNSDQTRRNGPKPELKKRIPKEIPWKNIQTDWKRRVKEARYNGMTPEAAIELADQQLDQLYPPNTQNTQKTTKNQAIPKKTTEENNNQQTNSINASTALTNPQPIQEHTEQAIQGLNQIPTKWLPLPSNAPLATEIAWVQANRLLVVREKGEQTLVFLRKANTPAPSYAALGWLETSIKTYAKFVEVAAKVTASVEGEEDMIRREKVAIADIERMLKEMLEPGDV